MADPDDRMARLAEHVQEAVKKAVEDGVDPDNVVIELVERDG